MSWWQKLAGKVRSVFGGPGAKSGGCDHSEIQLRQGTAEFEEFIVRAELETTKNLKHAAGHLGNLLSYDPGRPEWIELLETFLKEAGPDAEGADPTRRQALLHHRSRCEPTCGTSRAGSSRPWTCSPR